MNSPRRRLFACGVIRGGVLRLRVVVGTREHSTESTSSRKAST